MNVIESLQERLDHIIDRLKQIDREIEELHQEIECVNQHNIFNSNQLFAIQEGMKEALKK